MGHWAPNSGMAARYDSLACVAELVQKSKVRNAFSSGWGLVAPGCVPRDLPAQPRPSSLRVQVQSSRPKGSRRNSLTTRGSPDRYVIMTTNQRLHGHRSGIYTMCKQWKCGDQDNPVQSALFIDLDKGLLAGVEVCKKCLAVGMQDPMAQMAPQESSRSLSCASSSSSTSLGSRS